MLASRLGRAESVLALVVPLLFTHPGHAQTPEGSRREDSPGPDSPSFHADVEVDPTAYVLDGFSLHAGLGWKRLRVDLGAFAIKVPEFIHGQRGFELAFDGYGVKVQLFPFKEPGGLFVGVDAGVARASVHRVGTELTVRDNQVTLGINAGYRIELGAGFYATPWLGVGYAIGVEDVTLAGQTFSGSALVVFPAVHVGYHVR